MRNIAEFRIIGRVGRIEVLDKVAYINVAANYGRKVNGDYSVHKGGYRTLRDSGKFVKNHVPVNLRDSFIQEYITKDLEYFEKNFKDAKGYKSNKFDWINR